MSQYKIMDPDDLMECPYDKTHMVAAKRFPYHLNKCRKNYTGKDFVSCPFNAKHEMMRPELRFHMANCPDRAMIEPDIAFEENKNKENGGTLFKGCTDVPSYNNWKPPPQTENWEKESSKYPRIGIDPAFYEKHFINIPGMTKSEKKENMKKLFAEQDNGNKELRRPETTGQAQKLSQQPMLSPCANNGLRRPQTTGQAQQLSQQTMQLPNQPPLPNNVFAYSLSTVGIGRGKVTGQIDGDPPSLPPGIPSQPCGLARGHSIGASLGMAPENLFLRQPDSQTFSMGIGRGMMAYADRESPSFIDIVPKVKPQNYNLYDSAGDSQASSADNSDAETSNVRDNIRDAKIKKQKRLMKKLRQIENLVEDKSKGKQLTAEEEAKIASRTEIQKELDSLK